MTKTPISIAPANGARPSNDSHAEAPLADAIGATGSPLDLAAQQAGTQTLLRGLAIIEAIAGGARDMRASAPRSARRAAPRTASSAAWFRRAICARFRAATCSARS